MAISTGLHSLWGHLAGFAWVAMRSFAAALVGLLALGAVLAAASYYVLQDQPEYAAVAVVLTLVESFVAGVFLGGKRAVTQTLLHGLSKLQLGATVVKILFERLLGLSAEKPPGESGRLAKALQRIPLAQAEQGLRAVVQSLVAAKAGKTGWLRGSLLRTLLYLVQEITLGRFRKDGARDGEVELAKVQSELQFRADELLTARLRWVTGLWSVAVILGLPVLVFLQTSALLALATNK